MEYSEMVVAETPQTAGPGWYADPNDPKTNRYWDGASWTENRTPRKAEATDKAGAGSFIAAVLLPIVGAIIAIVQFARGNSGSGAAVLLTSIVAGVVWFVILAGIDAAQYDACIENARGLSQMADC
jgi:hypothetical protein